MASWGRVSRSAVRRPEAFFVIDGPSRSTNDGDRNERHLVTRSCTRRAPMARRGHGCLALLEGGVRQRRGVPVQRAPRDRCRRSEEPFRIELGRSDDPRERSAMSSCRCAARTPGPFTSASTLFFPDPETFHDMQQRGVITPRSWRALRPCTRLRQGPLVRARARGQGRSATACAGGAPGTQTWPAASSTRRSCRYRSLTRVATSTKPLLRCAFRGDDLVDMFRLTSPLYFDSISVCMSCRNPRFDSPSSVFTSDVINQPTYVSGVWCVRDLEAVPLNNGELGQCVQFFVHGRHHVGAGS